MCLKKKSFVLLEILIAFSLVSIAILPFLRYPYQHVKQQFDFLYDMELQSHAQAELAKWEVALYQKDPHLDERAFGEKKIKAQYDKGNAEVKIELFKGQKKIFHKKLYLHQTARKQSSDGTLFSLVEIKVQYFHPKKLNKPLLTAKRQVVAQKKL